MVRPLGGQLYLRDVVGPAWPARDRRGHERPLGPAGRPLARGPPEPRRGLGRDLRELPRPRACRLRPVDAEPDRLGAPGAVRGRRDDRRRRGGGRRLPSPDAASRRKLERPALERHRLPARLLPQVPPLRRLLPPVGPRSLSHEPVMTPWAARPVDLVALVGRAALSLVGSLGRFGTFFASAVAYAVTPPFKTRQLVDRIHFIGYNSLVIIALTGAFTGMVLGLQVFITLSRFGSEAFLGPAVALSLIRELGPVLAALMVTGRAGSALTAEIGIMRITEQIDALTVMALNPFRYLVTPSILAGIVTFPMMTALFDVVGIFGGYLVGVKLLGLSEGTYFGEMRTFVDFHDVMTGFWKSLSFGAIVTWVATYKGFYVGHGAEGVARATTQAVVLASVLILVWDYFLGSILP